MSWLIHNNSSQKYIMVEALNLKNSIHYLSSKIAQYGYVNLINK